MVLWPMPLKPSELQRPGFGTAGGTYPVPLPDDRCGPPS